MFALDFYQTLFKAMLLESNTLDQNLTIHLIPPGSKLECF